LVCFLVNKMWYDSLKKSSLTPPPIYFTWVWIFIYITIIISVSLVLKSLWNVSNDKIKNVLIIFFIKIMLNFLWIYVFFTKQNILLSFLVAISLDIVTLITIINFYKINKISGLILIPNFLWLCFATYLNYYILRFNK
jgi:benzodiazapine receptor